MEQGQLDAAHRAALGEAQARFERERFGSQVTDLRASLLAAIEREHGCDGGAVLCWGGEGGERVVGRVAGWSLVPA